MLSAVAGGAAFGSAFVFAFILTFLSVFRYGRPFVSVVSWPLLGDGGQGDRHAGAAAAAETTLAVAVAQAVGGDGVAAAGQLFAQGLVHLGRAQGDGAGGAALGLDRDVGRAGLLVGVGHRGMTRVCSGALGRGLEQAGQFVDAELDGDRAGEGDRASLLLGRVGSIGLGIGRGRVGRCRDRGAATVAATFDVLEGEAGLVDSVTFGCEGFADAGDDDIVVEVDHAVLASELHHGVARDGTVTVAVDGERVDLVETAPLAHGGGEQAGEGGAVEGQLNGELHFFSSEVTVSLVKGWGGKDEC